MGVIPTDGPYYSIKVPALPDGTSSSPWYMISFDADGKSCKVPITLDYLINSDVAARKTSSTKKYTDIFSLASMNNDRREAITY